MPIDAKLAVDLNASGPNSRAQNLLASVIDSTGTDVVSRSFDVPFTNGTTYKSVDLEADLKLSVGAGNPGIVLIVLEREGDSNVIGVGDDTGIDVAFSNKSPGSGAQAEWLKTGIKVSDILAVSCSELPQIVAFRVTDSGKSRRVTMFVTGTAAI